MKTQIVFLLSILTLAFAGCSTVPETGRMQLMMVSSGEEAQMGLSSFDEIKKQEKISTNAAANAQVKRVGQRIANSVGRELPNAQWEFVVFDSDQVNAFALPGGKVGVYTGLLKLVASDDELAIVMGHEVAHVSSRHGAERVSQNMAVSLGAQLGAAFMNYKNISADKQNMIMGLYGAGAQVGALLPFSRLHESEADKIGLRFAAGAGYDPRAGATFWKKMAAKSGSSNTPAWMSTHPQDADRIAALEKLAPQYMDLYQQSKAKYTGM